MDIEEVAKTHPESIFVVPICPEVGLTEDNLNEVVSKLNLTEVAADAKNQIKNIYKMFNALDAT